MAISFSGKKDFKNIPGTPIAYWLSDEVLCSFETCSAFAEHGKVLVGLQTGDNERFTRFWHEVSVGKTRMADAHASWVPYVKGGEYRKWYGNRDMVLDWSQGGNAIINHPSARPQNREYYFRSGVTYTNVSSGAFSARFVDDKGIFDQKGSMIFSEYMFSEIAFMALLLSKSRNKVSRNPLSYNRFQSRKYRAISGSRKRYWQPSNRPQNGWSCFLVPTGTPTKPLGISPRCRCSLPPMGQSRWGASTRAYAPVGAK